MKKTIFIFLSIIVLFFSACEKEIPPVPGIDLNDEAYQNYFGIDIYHKIIVYNGTEIKVVDGKLEIEDFVFDLESSDNELSPGKEYNLLYKEEIFKFYYTELPVISITTLEDEILDDPKIGGKVHILEKGEDVFTSHIGIELRGGVSQYYPKKSYSMELWESVDGSLRKKKSLLGMRDDDDWVLDGMWNEPIRVRDFSSHSIWAKIARIKDAGDDSNASIERRYCELFINGKYQGVYYLGEKFDRKQLDLKKYDGQIEGELYKGYTWADGVTYKGVKSYDNNSITWNGYEAKYPDELSELDWTKLYKHIDFVVNSSQSDFNEQISIRIDMDNAMDYFIFLNLIFAPDNIGKNVYTCKMNSESGYFFMPWDLDGSFGNDWQGERIDVTDHILTNGLFDKLFHNYEFKSGLKERWTDLRSNTLTNGFLKQLFEDNFNYLNKNAIYQREAIVPELTQNHSDLEIIFITEWIDARLYFLDNYFASL